MLKTRPMILMVRPATAVPRLVDFIPFKDMTSPTIVIGRPNIGRSQATNPMMPKTRPAVALPVGLSIGFGGCVFSIVCCVLCLRKMSSGLTTQAQRRRPRDAPIATATARRRSLQRMVRPLHGDSFGNPAHPIPDTASASYVSTLHAVEPVALMDCALPASSTTSDISEILTGNVNNSKPSAS